MNFTNPNNLKGCQDCPRRAGETGSVAGCCANASTIFENAYYDYKRLSLETFDVDVTKFAGLGPSAGIASSEETWQRALKVIPAGTQTLSKGPSCFVEGVSPKYLLRGKGSRVWDVDGNEYIDYGLGCLPITLGYNFPEIDKAIQDQLADGITFTMMHPLEVEVSERLVDMIPGAEMVRFGKNGSDVTAMSIRLARHITGRDRVACLGYHGFQDWYIATTDRSFGIPETVKELTSTFTYNDIDSLKALFDANPGEFACVIMEPAIFEFPEPGFLESVRELTHQHGALLVFDEMITGMRFAVGGGQEFFGVVPDLACFGKGIANGMPLGVLAGLEKHMRNFEEVFFSSTYGGEALTLAAAKAGLDFYANNPVLPRLWRAGKTLFDNFNASIKARNMEENASVSGFPVRFMVSFVDANGEGDHRLNALFQQEMTKRGIVGWAIFGLSYSHSDEELLYTTHAFAETLDVIKEAIASDDLSAYMEGTPPEPVFKALREKKQTAN